MNRECPECGMHTNVLNNTRCQKCDFELVDHLIPQLFDVDVCHGGEDWAEASVKILDGLNQALLSGFSGLRVIHGYGSSSGHTSIIKSRSKALINNIAQDKGYQIERNSRNLGETVLLF